MDNSVEQKPVVESGQQARQGRWGYQVFLVLVIGLVLAAVAWIALETWGEAIDENATQSSVIVAPSRG